MFSAVHCATVGGMAVVLLTRPDLFVWQLYKDPSHAIIKNPNFYSHGAKKSIHNTNPKSTSVCLMYFAYL